MTDITPTLFMSGKRVFSVLHRKRVGKWNTGSSCAVNKKKIDISHKTQFSVSTVTFHMNTSIAHKDTKHVKKKTGKLRHYRLYNLNKTCIANVGCATSLVGAGMFLIKLWMNQ